MRKSSGSKKCEVWTFSNHKGGVGKTSSAVNIGAALGRAGKRVLVIDMDPQANLSLSLGAQNATQHIYGCLSGEYGMASATIPVMENVKIVPSTIDLSGAEIELSSEAGREVILRELIEEVKEEYDYILIDCPPSLGLLTINALTATDKVLVPLQAEYLPTQGLTKLFEVVKKIKKRLNKEIEIGGVFVTRFDARKVLNREVVASIEKALGNIVLKTRIRDNIALAEAPQKGLDIFRYDPRSNGAIDYHALGEELMKRQ